jgi:glycosyltransferase involved in cell wall biosynthesis
MSRRLVILTEIISPYRIPVFNALARESELELHVIFLAETDPTQRQWFVYKDEIQFSYSILPSWRRRLGKYHVLLNRGLGTALNKAKPDVIVCGGYSYLAAWQALWWARRSHTPSIAWVESTARELRRSYKVVEFLKTRFLKACSGFIVPGKASFDYLRSFGLDESRIFIAPNAVGTEFFGGHAEMARGNAGLWRKTLGLPSRYFLFVGRLLKEKGVFDLLTAYGTLSPEVRSAVGLVFVGDGPYKAELVRRAVDISPGLVRFTGFLQREQLAEHYALAETFVFPTHTDPWGLVVNEAMACSLPIICSSAAGCADDLVCDGWNGRMVPAREVAQLASVMEELARDGDVREFMGQHSSQRILRNSPEACAGGIAKAALACGVPSKA